MPRGEFSLCLARCVVRFGESLMDGRVEARSSGAPEERIAGWESSKRSQPGPVRQAKTRSQARTRGGHFDANQSSMRLDASKFAEVYAPGQNALPGWPL